LMFGIGAVLVFINFLALRQAVTPQPLLGRMTSTMRWLTLLPAGPGALLGGYMGEHFGLRSALVFAGLGAVLLALYGCRQAEIRELLELPRPDDPELALGAEASVRPNAALAQGGP
jgi:MFS family permease